MNTQLLPLGSVVTLKEAEKKLMIIGIMIQDSQRDRLFDYLATPFPEGFIDMENMFLFNHNDIETIDYLGYVNSESQLYRAKLAQELEKQQVIKKVD